MIATLNLKNFSTLKVKLSDFSRKYQKSVVKTKKKASTNFSNENLWVVFQSRYIQIKFNYQSSSVSNPTPFISWYQPYQLDLVQVGEKNGNVNANQVPFIGPKFLVVTKRQFMAKEKKMAYIASTSHQVKRNCGITLRHQWLALDTRLIGTHWCVLEKNMASILSILAFFLHFLPCFCNMHHMLPGKANND